MRKPRKTWPYKTSVVAFLMFIASGSTAFGLTAGARNTLPAVSASAAITTPGPCR
jgi:hypothetical protein